MHPLGRGLRLISAIVVVLGLTSAMRAVEDGEFGTKLLLMLAAAIAMSYVIEELYRLLKGEPERE